MRPILDRQCAACTTPTSAPLYLVYGPTGVMTYCAHHKARRDILVRMALNADLRTRRSMVRPAGRAS